MRNTLRNIGLGILLGFGACSEEKSPNEGNLTPKEIMQKYFPLKVGNIWTYTRTVPEGSNVFNCTEATIEQSWDKPKGLTYMVISLGNAVNKMPNSSEETYSVSEKDEGVYWKIRVQGENPRDGRYTHSLAGKGVERTDNSPEVKWGYVGDGVWEIVRGEHLGDETRNQIWSVVIRPDIIISPPTKDNKHPDWAIGAKMHDSEIKVPAGNFKNCLMNCRIVHGKNLEDVLFRDTTPIYEGDFGCFRTESFFAKNVGLVKEVQYDGKGNIAYSLELKSFRVK